MPHLALDQPIYKITCPVCHSETRYSLFDMTTRQRVNCPRCYESIKVVDQYRRSELEDLAEKLGLSRDFLGVNDASDEIVEGDILRGMSEELIGNG